MCAPPRQRACRPLYSLRGGGRGVFDGELLAGDRPAALRPDFILLRRECEVDEILPPGLFRGERLLKRGDGELPFRKRTYRRNGKASLRYRDAVFDKLPRAREFVSVREAETVDEKDARGGSRLLHDEIAVDVCDLDEFRADVSFRVYDAVVAERPVVGFFVEVSAVGEEALELARLGVEPPRVFPHALVDPIPDASAGKRFVRIEDVPVFREVAH